MNNFNPSTNVYEDMYKFEQEYWWYLSLREILKYYISKFKVKIILDAGCGTGANISEMKSITKDVYGVDISQKAIKFAELKIKENIYMANITHLPFNDSFFDLIYCMDVFGNLNQESALKTLDEFNRCLKKDGKLIIQTAGISWLNSSHDKYWDIQKRYNLKELEELVIGKKFKILKSTYRHFFLFPIIFLIKLLNKFKTKKSGDFQNLPYLANYILFLIMKFENFLLRFLSYPIGSSVFIIAEKI